MTRRSIAALLAVLSGSALVIAQRAPNAPSLLIRSVTLFDGNAGPPQTGVNILPNRGYTDAQIGQILGGNAPFACSAPSGRLDRLKRMYHVREVLFCRHVRGVGTRRK